MANRYWVGGSGTWNSTSTTNWSASSGGLSGASVPTAADSVFFDQAGTYTVTLQAITNMFCLDITVSAGTVTIAGTSGTLTISGSMSLIAGTVWSSTGAITFNATTSGKTITTNGVTITGAVTFNGVGGGWTLGSAFTTSGNITLTNGTLNTSNFSVTAASLVSSSTTARTMNLGSSTVTLASAVTSVLFNATNFTFNAGTSQININPSTSATFTGAGVTFYNVLFGGTGRTISISGGNTFNNLGINGPSSTGLRSASLASDQIINGTFSPIGASEIRRIFISSNAFGVSRSLTLNGGAPTANCDFRDISVVGGLDVSAAGGGDCGGNTNITFPAPKTVYWNLSGTQNWSATGWATISGGSPAAANFPLAQDTAVFNNAGSATSVTINDVWNIGTIDMSYRSSSMTLATGTNTPSIYGSWANGVGVSLTGSGVLSFVGRGNTQQIVSNGISFTQPIGVSNIGGIVQLQGALTTSSTNTTTLTYGTLDLNGFTLTTGLFNGAGSATRSIAFGTGNITVTGTGTVWTTSTSTSLTVTGTPVVNVSNGTATAATVSPGSLSEANSISFNYTTGTYALTLSAGSARNLNFTGFSGTVSNTAQSIYGDLTVSAAATYTAGANIWTFASTSATPRTITTNGERLDFPLTFNGVGGTWVLQDALTMGSTRSCTHANGTLDLNGKTLTVGIIYTVGAGTKNLTFNGGTLVCPNNFSNSNPTGYTTTAGTGNGTISMTSASSKTFAGGGSTFNCVLNLGGTGALTVTGSNTFRDITNTVQPTSVLFTAGTTTTFTSGFSLSGTAGNLVTISSATAAQHTLVKASGIVDVSYCNISYSNATGGATWNAFV